METLNSIEPPHEILVVEDSPTQAARLKHILERNGYRFSAAVNGRDALESIDLRCPSLVISDIVMPEMDGYQLCREIKQNSETMNIPVILLTSLNDPIDVMRGLECGADNFIFKPYNERYLLSRIAYILANRYVRETEGAQMGVEIVFSGRKFFITSDRLQILNLLLSTYEVAVERNRELTAIQDELRHFNEDLEARVAERTAALQAEVSERRRAEARIREQAELLDKARDAILLKDLDGVITFWNKSAEALYGWTAAEALNRKAFELLLPRDSRAEHEIREAVLERGEWAGEVRYFTKSGEERIVDSRLTLIHDESGNPKSILSIDTDITEKKRLQLQLQRSERMDSIGMLAGGVAHDLNNAFAPILLGTDLLRSSISDPRNQKLIDNIQLSAQHGAALVQQLLAFARGSEGHRTDLEISGLIGSVQALLRPSLPRSVELIVEAPGSLWPIRADATGLKQVLINLCLNARDAMPEGGRLEIRAENVHVEERVAALHPGAIPGPHVSVGVRDTGSGMPGAVMERIFDPFFTTKPAGEGTGLGLSVVAGIIKSHGGFVHLESEPGLGTLFQIFLPAPARPSRDESASTSPFRIRGRGEGILLIDDDPVVRDTFRLVLEDARYRVVTAAGGPEGIAEYQRDCKALAVVIIDIEMPVMNGPAVIAALRALNPRQPILAISGLMDPARMEALRALTPPVECLAKPISIDTFLITLRRLIDHQPPA